MASASAPRGDGDSIAENGSDYLIGALVREKSFELNSNLWDRFLCFPLDLLLHRPDQTLDGVLVRSFLSLPDERYMEISSKFHYVV